MNWDVFTTVSVVYLGLALVYVIGQVVALFEKPHLVTPEPVTQVG